MYEYLKLIYPKSEQLIDVTNASALKIQNLHSFYKSMNPKVISHILSTSVELPSMYAEN